MSLRNPVKYPVKYYSWQDAQAPQLSNADGVIKTILKACLMTGYGSKQGAGWTSLFEDDYRIVLRRPLRTGNPPDIKIENGTFAVSGTNTTRHRIVAQNTPTGLDDTNELSSANIVARDSSTGKEWYCIVTDFGFLLCYQMGVNGPSSGSKNNMLYVGGAKNLKDATGELFFCTVMSNTSANGTAGYNLLTLIRHAHKNLVTNTDYNCAYLSITGAELSINNDYLAQKILIAAEAEMPFYCSVFDNASDLTTKQISVNARSMLRFSNYIYTGSGQRAMYIPLDYWEL